MSGENGGTNQAQPGIGLSKIKRIAIELKDYHFFHSPYQRAHQYKTFIGREKKIEQFKSVLTDVISDSGAYLVTGYRGSGKTSFVNIVLSDIATTQHLSNRSLQLLRIWFALMVLVPIFQASFNYYPKITWSIVIILLFLSVCLLCLFNQVRPTCSKRKERGLVELKPGWERRVCKNLIPNLFYISQDEKSDDMLINLTRGIFIGCLCTALTKIFIPFQVNENFFAYTISCQIYFIFAIGLYAIGLKIWELRLEQIKHEYSTKVNSDSSSLLIKFYNIIKESFCWFRNRVKTVLKPRLVIRLNLNYGSLNERNVLSLIATTLLDEYRRWRLNFFQRLLCFSQIFILWIIVSVTYQTANLKKPIVNFTEQEYYDLLVRFPDANKILGIPIKTSLDTLPKTISNGLTKISNDTRYVLMYKISETKIKAKSDTLFITIPNGFTTISNDTIYVHVNKISDAQKDSLGQLCFGQIVKHTNSLYQLKSSLSLGIRKFFFPKNMPGESNKHFGYSVVTLPDIIYENINSIYEKIREIVLGGMKGAIPFRIYHCPLISWFMQRVYPPKFEPLLFLIFGIVFVISYWLRHNRWINLPGHSRVLRLLQDLDQRIAAAVTVQSGVEMPAPKGLAKWFRSKSLTYPLADERTIEQGIIRVLDEVSRLPMIFGHPIFIFVFDELDKINLPEDMSKDRDEEMLYMSSFDNMRRRQQQVEKILSNLKQLITTTHAKFIFIAGREMYDASLADFTGRSFFQSSIFNQTFYVDSFLTDHSDPDENSLTSIVESYVCRFLLPGYETNWCMPWPKLTYYKRYLEERFDFSENNDKEKEKRVIQKILQILHDFVPYLTYRGNGSPKKITQLFENFIQPLPDNIGREEWLVVGENYKSRYLVFSYTQQFVIGSTARLLEPLYHTMERTARLYNDKLTTSIFLTLDYLFKFHRSAFRRDFLEWMPEMLDIHRDPDLRTVIHEMLELIENAYLEKVGNGLFDYRFTNRIKGEIDFASRVSELESAALNFTLDESLEAEQFMRRQLKDQLQLCETSKKGNEPKSNVAISHLHETIGDLHAFDGEYDQAVTEYFNALDCLNPSAKKGTTDGKKL